MRSIVGRDAHARITRTLRIRTTIARGARGGRSSSRRPSARPCPRLITTARGEEPVRAVAARGVPRGRHAQVPTTGSGSPRSAWASSASSTPQTALKVPGVELVAVADLYEGRRVHAKEVFGDRIAALRRLSRDPGPPGRRRGPGLRSRPLAFADRHRRHEGRQGRLLREADGPAGRRGSRRHRRREGDRRGLPGRQPVRQLADLREGPRADQPGAIGAINSVEARYNRNSPIGAWQYTIPPDASPADDRLGPVPGHAHPSARSIPSASSAGGTTPTTARPSRATCSSTC